MALSLTACGSSSSKEPNSSTTPPPVASSTPAGDKADELADYPSGTVTWIAPVAAGAAVDLPTRACADLLTFGTVVVENIAGASQTLGTAEAAARDADGHTLLTMANACGISQPILNSELAYSLDDFRFLSMLTPSVQATICVKKGSDLAEDVYKRQSQSKGLSTTTVHSVHLMLHVALGRAVKERFIPRNPCKDCIVPKPRKLDI